MVLKYNVILKLHIILKYNDILKLYIIPHKIYHNSYMILSKLDHI